ncbi:MAG: hypothetical protein JW720_14730 [Sedimentisphaerales bacterium]|nr:hypothetical protein [Sedimentisphaerales bacterium]
MEDAILRSRLTELVLQANSIPTPAVRKSGPKANAPDLDTETGKNSIQDLLDSLGVIVKYLMFDIEATKRENDVLRAIIMEDE